MVVFTTQTEIYCLHCKEHHPISEFRNPSIINGKTYYRNKCKKYYSILDKKNREENIEYYIEYNRNYYQDNKEYFADHSKEYQKENREGILKQRRIYSKNRMKNDPSFKLRKIASDAIFCEIKKNGFAKGKASILGFLPDNYIENLRAHIE